MKKTIILITVGLLVITGCIDAQSQNTRLTKEATYRAFTYIHDLGGFKKISFEELLSIDKEIALEKIYEAANDASPNTRDGCYTKMLAFNQTLLMEYIEHIKTVLS